jgi:hypothetical protein
MEEMPGSLEGDAMIAAADTDLVPMRVSKAVALGDGPDVSEYLRAP